MPDTARETVGIERLKRGAGLEASAHPHAIICGERPGWRKRARSRVADRGFELTDRPAQPLDQIEQVRSQQRGNAPATRAIGLPAPRAVAVRPGLHSPYDVDVTHRP